MDYLSQWFKPELIWFIVGLVLLLFEFVMPGLIIFFFGVGAWLVAMLCLLFGLSLNAQLLVFLVASVVLLLLLRRWLKAVFVGHTGSKQNLEQKFDDFLGANAVVTQAISPNTAGKVEFHGTTWEAEADHTIDEGTPVEIMGKDSITLKVRSLERSES